MKFATIVFFVLVQMFEKLRWLPESVQFTRHSILGVSRGAHSRVPAYAV